MEQILKNVLLLSDIDGTLAHHVTEIPERNLQAIRRFQAMGGAFAFATGRSPQVAAEIVARLHPNAPCVFINGSCIADPVQNKIIAAHFLPDSVRPFLRKVSERFPQVAMDLFEESQIAVLNANSYSRYHQQIHGVLEREVTLDTLPQKMHKALLMADADVIAALRVFYEQEKPADTECMCSNPTFFEIMPAGINKGSGLRDICAALQIPREHAYAIGDYENDFAMLEAAGTAAAPANAVPGALARAKVHVCACEAGAVAEFIEYIIAKYTES